MAKRLVIDGLVTLREEFSTKQVASLIERTARWVSPETFRLLPLWFPEHGRGHHFYKGNWSEPQMNIKRGTDNTTHEVEGNVHANKALTLALGMRHSSRPNWSCCHIWGIDDSSYQKSNLIVRDHRFFSCIGNMILLPTPLKAFTDTMPEIKAMLRICARNLYGWTCDHESIRDIIATLDAWDAWDDYPQSWPRSPGEKRPKGLIEMTSEIQRSADNRRAAIDRDLKTAGAHYPTEDVQAALKYWDDWLASNPPLRGPKIDQVLSA